MMCGSFALMLPLKQLLQYFSGKYDGEIKLEDELDDFQPASAIYPTDSVPVARSGSAGGKKGIQLETQSWGFRPDFSSRPIINARAETVKEKNTFARSFRERRCLVPATSFFEWQERGNDGKKKYSIGLKDREVFTLAGLYRSYEIEGREMNFFTILTRPAVSRLEQIHDRMPVILGTDQEKRWMAADQPAGALQKMMLEGFREELEIDPPPEDFQQLQLF